MAKIPGVTEKFVTPTYSTFVSDVSSTLLMSWRELEPEDLTPAGWVAVLKEDASYSKYDLLAVLFWAIVWGIVRSIMTSQIFQKIALMLRLGKKEEKSFPESLWKLFFSVSAWAISTHLVIYKYELFDNPVRTITEWKLHSEVPFDIYVAYMFQVSYYTYSIYATLVLDEYRKDSGVLLLHHAVSILLIAISYLFRYIYLGILVLYLHDFSDIFLESTKLFVYCKSKGGRWRSICDFISTIGFIVFGCSWYLFRLYWFPLKAIYVTGHISRILYPDFVPPFFIAMNGLLVTLLIMHIYWFNFIVQMAYRVVTGKTKEIDDVREYEEEPKSSHKKHNGIQSKTD